MLGIGSTCGNDDVAARINQESKQVHLIAAKSGLVDPYCLLTRVWSTRKHAIPLICMEKSDIEVYLPRAWCVLNTGLLHRGFIGSGNALGKCT